MARYPGSRFIDHLLRYQARWRQESRFCYQHLTDSCFSFCQWNTWNRSDWPRIHNVKEVLSQFCFWKVLSSEISEVICQGWSWCQDPGPTWRGSTFTVEWNSFLWQSLTMWGGRTGWVWRHQSGQIWTDRQAKCASFLNHCFEHVKPVSTVSTCLVHDLRI